MFADLDKASVGAIIDVMEYEIIDAGATICTADKFYLIMSGCCDVCGD